MMVFGKSTLPCNGPNQTANLAVTMKSNLPATPSSTAQQKIVSLRLQVLAARKRADVARDGAHKAKLELKRFRKAYKQAKRLAKDERKKVKAWKKMLAAAKAASRNVAAKPKKVRLGEEASPKPRPSGRSDKQDSKQPKKTKSLDQSESTRLLPKQYSSGSTADKVSPAQIAAETNDMPPSKLTPTETLPGV